LGVLVLCCSVIPAQASKPILERYHRVSTAAGVETFGVVESFPRNAGRQRTVDELSTLPRQHGISRRGGPFYVGACSGDYDPNILSLCHRLVEPIDVARVQMDFLCRAVNAYRSLHRQRQHLRPGSQWRRILSTMETRLIPWNGPFVVGACEGLPTTKRWGQCSP